MSRNKDIKFLHEFTGMPYSVCRRQMKACGWDLMKALGYDQMEKIIEAMPDIIDNLGKAMNRILASIGTALKTIGQNLEETYGELEVKPIEIGGNADRE